ncbi:VCBS repeat-containing protein [Streptomyces sp. NPDC003038]|uniref:FG-GAP repeat domain-containing protein n=1 Tax=unclassified Streptomyces TaxID=2593676 RepID=UPI0033AA4AF6
MARPDCTPGPAKADGTFNAAAASWKVADGNWWIFHATFRVGDTKGDGRDDILALYGYTGGGVAMFTFQAQANGGFAAPVKSWTRTKEQWPYASTKFTTGDYNGDGRDDVLTMYTYHNGSTGAFTFKGRTDGGFENGFLSWQTLPGTW